MRGSWDGLGEGAQDDGLSLDFVLSVMGMM